MHPVKCFTGIKHNDFDRSALVVIVVDDFINNKSTLSSGMLLLKPKLLIRGNKHTRIFFKNDLVKQLTKDAAQCNSSIVI